MKKSDTNIENKTSYEKNEISNVEGKKVTKHRGRKRKNDDNLDINIDNNSVGKEKNEDINKNVERKNTRKKVKEDKLKEVVVNETLENTNDFSKSEKAVENNEGANKFVAGKFNLDFLDILILIIITAIVSCFITGFILNRQYRDLTKEYQEVLKDDNVSRFANTYNEIVNNYYEEIDQKAMVDAAIDGMMNFLKESYSIYLDQNETNDLSETLDGSYEGIGILAEGPTVVHVYENSPAEKAGMKEADVIKEVNGVLITVENYQEISNIIKNNEKDINTIVVLRDEKELTFELKTDKVVLPVVSGEVLEVKDKKIGYMVFTSFSSTSYEQFQEELLKIEKEAELDSLIIDVRDNTGGYLESAYNISSIFLKKDKIIYSLESKGEVKKYKDKDNQSKEYPIVVLVNSGTASAAEILTLALKESYGATIVGKTTYGKGKVQSMIQYDDTMVKYTSAKWLGPNGNCIDEIGIVPDYEVDLEVSDNIIYDKQLDKAIELLTK